VRFQDLNSDAQNTLSEENVSYGGVDVFPGWVTGVDHHTVDEFHAFRSLSSDFTGDNDFATSSTLFHDESENTVGGSSDGEASEEFVSEGFGLSDGGETSVSDSFDVKIDLTLFVSPSFVDDGGQFSNSSSFLAEHLGWSGGDDDDFAGLGFSDDDAGVSILGEFSLEELVEFGFKETVSDEEVFLGDWPTGLLSLSLSHFYWVDVFVIFCKFDLRL